MAELAMLAEIQRTVYRDEVTRQLHVMCGQFFHMTVSVKFCVTWCGVFPVFICFYFFLCSVFVAFRSKFTYTILGEGSLLRP